MMMRTVLMAMVTLPSLVRVSSSEPPACEYEDGPQKCKTRCDQGSQTSCASLGLMYLRGQFVKSDLAAAEPLLQKACDANVPVGCGGLGSLFVVRGNRELGRPLLERGCNMGDGLACESVAGIEGELEAAKPKRDIKELIRRQTPFYRRACELGTANGCAFVGAFILDKAIDGSAQEAFDLYVKACSRGNAIACRRTAGLLHRNEQEWKAIAAKLDVDRLTADLMSRACKLGDAKSCAPAKPSP
jgi:uncharacterized protein